MVQLVCGISRFQHVSRHWLAAWCRGNHGSLRFAGQKQRQEGPKFESAVKTLRHLEVNTWLDKPDNPVALKVTMHALPDGTSYPGNVVLSIPSSNIEVRIAKSSYQRLAP